MRLAQIGLLELKVVNNIEYIEHNRNIWNDINNNNFGENNILHYINDENWKH